jgi:hypothetical protein
MTTALFLATVAGFVITATGVYTGLFGGDAGGEPAQPTPAALAPATPAPSLPPPQVVEQVVYRDEYVRAPASGGAGAQPPAEVPQPQASVPDAPAAPPPPATAPIAATAQPTANPTQPPAGNTGAVDIDGRVMAVAGDTFTLGETRFGTAVISVNGATHFEGGNHSSLTPGARVEAKVLAAGGTSPTGPAGSWIAVNVHIEDD